jgi:hypothetical protein
MTAYFLRKDNPLLRYATLAGFYEAHQFGDVRGAFECKPHLFEGLAGVELRSQKQAIGAFNGANAFGAKAAALQSDAIDAETPRIPLADDQREGWNVLSNHGRGTDIRIEADAAELVHWRKCANRGVILDRHVSGQSGAIGENRVVADNAIVSYMSRSHNEVIVSYARYASTLDGSTAHRNALAKHIAVPDFQARALSRVLQILGFAANSAKRMQHVAAAQASRAVYNGMRV